MGRPTGTPTPPLAWAIALGACAAAGASVALAVTSDHLAEPGLRAGLLDWITLPYVLGGLVAWWRRPDSRFGPLMVATGFAMFVSSLQWANAALPYTLGLAFDLLPPALFIHVFLAFPSGRLERRAERVVVAAAYSAAGGLQLVKMMLGACSLCPASPCLPPAGDAPAPRCGARSRFWSIHSPSGSS